MSIKMDGTASFRPRNLQLHEVLGHGHLKAAGGLTGGCQRLVQYDLGRYCIAVLAALNRKDKNKSWDFR